LGDGVAGQAGNVGQPRTRPQALDGQEGRLGGDAQGRDTPEPRRRENLADTPHLVGEPLAGAGPEAAFRYGDEEDQGGGQGQDGEHQEDAAPVGESESAFHRYGCGQRAEAAGRHLKPVDQRNAVRREPHDIGLEGGHQAGRGAEADQGPADDQGVERLGQGEDQRAQSGDDEKGGLRAPGAEAVEQDAERQLEGGESEEVGAGQES